MAKIVLYPTPVRKKRKKERKKRLILFKNIYIFKNKTSEIKSSCQHSGQQLSHGGNCYTVREENKGQMVAFTKSLVVALNTNIQGFPARWV